MTGFRRTILALAVVTATVVLVLVGQAVLVVGSDVRSTDLRKPSHSLSTRVAANLISAENTISFREALRLLKDKTGAKAKLAERRAKAETKLERLTRHGSHRSRSAAVNLLAILRLRDALLARGDASAAVASAIASFTRAVRLDPRNTDAKYNLELLLTLRPKSKQQKSTQPVPKQSAAATGHAGTVHTGAGY